MSGLGKSKLNKLDQSNVFTGILFLASFIVLVGGLLLARQNERERPPEGPWLTVSSQVLELKELQPRESRVVHLELRNAHPKQPVRILGASDYCGALGCVSTLALPTAVPPLGTLVLELEFQASGGVGEFKMPYSIFTDAPGLSEIPLNIVGRVVPKAAAGGDQPKGQAMP